MHSRTLISKNMLVSLSCPLIAREIWEFCRISQCLGNLKTRNENGQADHGKCKLLSPEYQLGIASIHPTTSLRARRLLQSSGGNAALGSEHVFQPEPPRTAELRGAGGN